MLRLAARMVPSRSTSENPVAADSNAPRNRSSPSRRLVSSDTSFAQGLVSSVFMRRPISMRSSSGGVRETGSDGRETVARMLARDHRLYDRVKPWCAPDRLEIRIIRHRLLVAETVSNSALKMGKGVLSLVHQSVHAGDVVEYQRIVGLDRERLRRELERPGNVAQLHQRRGAEVVRARVIRVHVESLLDQLHRPSSRRVCVSAHSHTGVCAAEESGCLEIIGLQQRSAFEHLRRFGVAPLVHEGPSIEIEGIEQLWVELDCLLEFLLRVPELLRDPQRERSGEVGLREIRSQLESLLASDIRLHRVDPLRVEIDVKERAGDRDSGIGEGIARVGLDRLFVHLHSVLQALSPVLMKKLAAAEIVVVRINVDGAHLSHRELFAFAQNDSQRFDDRLGYVVLDRENVLHLAIVLLGPEVVAVGGVNQLRRDAELIAYLPHTSFQNGRDFELASDLADIVALSLESER